MLSQEYGEALLQQGLPNRIDQYPIGTGPFKFENYRKDHYIRYQRHQTYWG